MGAQSSIFFTNNTRITLVAGSGIVFDQTGTVVTVSTTGGGGGLPTGTTGQILISQGTNSAIFSNTAGTETTILSLSNDSQGISSLGDTTGQGNGSALTIIDTTQRIAIGSTSGAGGLNIVVGGGHSLTEIGDYQSNGNGTIIIVDDNAQTVTISALNGISFPTATTTEILAISSPTEGQCVWNTTTHRINIYNGSAWQYIAGTNGN
jgi:hypothetical protein